ncbi:MAG: metallopeptidase TldD-related protein [Lachnospiraceae bacterium]|nr:metallopeptidase TldD-related protein [Lachnospiraceae bacterium]MCM1239156.1 metallopeptidase TldD-related protein [Lachnospiraceae bacterium]MCM1304694.1 metallopeptidase TldD-related protein [Butyrivibrio sp.]MCM1344986.1 metallopeptidase TldD-related protein [Muribaculaceae bacterium]MCM1412176.1 metallopeptidase TldD-related protein [Lachnospiraceae bacterium]
MEKSLIEKILPALKKSGVEIYQITETKEESAELFFVRKSLDMQRRKEVRQAEVVVYKEFWEGEKHLTGSATVLVQESFTEGQLVEMFRDALYAAGFVKNQYYELYKGADSDPKGIEDFGALADVPLAELAREFSEALFVEDTEEDVFLNSAEVFAMKTTCHIVNSRGVDVGFRKGKVKGEFVAQCVDGQDVETYQDFAYEDRNGEALRKKVRHVLEMTRARAKAFSAPPAGEYRIILSGSFVREVLSYYMSRSDSSMIYQKYSSFQVGCGVQGEGVEKDRIHLTLQATVPYSGEGIPMKDRVLVQDGELQLIHGGNRFAYYLGLEPTGNYSKIKMPAGRVSLEDMKKTPYLEIVNFSDFQMDDFTGHFGGEIRLAFLYDGEKVIPVTGGSVNGNILEAQKGLVFSRETQTEGIFEGPMAVSMEHINVAG